MLGKMGQNCPVDVCAFKGFIGTPISRVLICFKLRSLRRGKSSFLGIGYNEVLFSLAPDLLRQETFLLG